MKKSHLLEDKTLETLGCLACQLGCLLHAELACTLDEVLKLDEVLTSALVLVAL